MTALDQNRPLHLRLPATSANLGPGFDALGLAMALYLTIYATAAEDFTIDATGRDAALCANLEDNLILTTYMDVLAVSGILAPPLHLQLHNEIPLGMGCGSSASALLAGILLADHFGNLNWTPQQILEEASPPRRPSRQRSRLLLGRNDDLNDDRRWNSYSNLRTKPHLELIVSPALCKPLDQNGPRSSP